MFTSLPSNKAFIAGGIIFATLKTEKFLIFSFWAFNTALAIVGEVVSNPTPINTISLEELS